MDIRCGIDLGGTKIEIIALNGNDEQIYQKRVATPLNDYAQTLLVIKNLVNNLELAINEHVSIGIGTPGAISKKTGRIKNANSLCLNNQSVLQDLETQLDRPIRISNDANCFTLSEVYDGSAKNYSNVFGVIVGTGTGAGIVINQQILTGANNIAGEWGHNPIPWPTKSELSETRCYCGKHGCIETFLSGPGLEADYFRQTNRICNSHEIVEAANKGDNASEQCLTRYENRMARALAHVINILDPDIIVLGGGMSNIERLYHNVKELLPEFVFSDDVLTKIVPAKFGDASGVRGAARLWPLTTVNT